MFRFDIPLHLSTLIEDDFVRVRAVRNGKNNISLQCFHFYARMNPHIAIRTNQLCEIKANFSRLVKPVVEDIVPGGHG